MPKRPLFILFVIALVAGMTPTNWVSQDGGIAYAVVGPVGGIVVDKEGEPVPDVTIRITDTQTGEVVDEDTSNITGGIDFWIPKDGTYRTEVIKDGQTVTTSDIDLRDGAKSLTVDMDARTITPEDVSWWEGARFEFSPGFYIPDGSSEIDRPAATIGGGLSFPLPVGDGHLRANFGYDATPGVGIDNDNLTRITGGPVMIGPLTDRFDVKQFDDSGTIHRTSAGLSFEFPMACGCIPFASFGFEWTRFGFDKENTFTDRTFPESPADRDITDASKDAVGFNLEFGALKKLPGDFWGRNAYAGWGFGLHGTSTSFPRGDDTFRLEPSFRAHFAIDLFGF